MEGRSCLSSPLNRSITDFLPSPTGIPSNGVIIQNVLFQDITGTALPGAQDYYILCGSGSCSNIVFDGVDITGGTVPSSCNFPPSGCPGP
jgi:polygalacturonase